MTDCVDILVISGGIAGLSAAAWLSLSAKVTVIERETHLGTHSSGRSATFLHFGIGNPAVRALTLMSRQFFEAPPSDFLDRPLSRPATALFIATEEMLPDLASLEAEMRRYTQTIERIDAYAVQSLVPILRTGVGHVVAGVTDHGARKLDSDALLQGFAALVRRNGGQVVMDSEVCTIERDNSDWHVLAGERDFRAKIVINAAGAWADELAVIAGVRPLGLTPLRRTIIVVDPPEDADIADWPFTKTARDEFYMLPESGKLLASPVDEVESLPCDAQPEEYDLALAAYRLEQFTTIRVKRVAHKWAGLRTFAKDRVPVAGFAGEAPGFFWLAGQGGYGLQTSVAMAEVTASLIGGTCWPAALTDLGIGSGWITPDRLTSGT